MRQKIIKSLNGKQALGDMRTGLAGLMQERVLEIDGIGRHGHAWRRGARCFRQAGAIIWPHLG